MNSAMEKATRIGALHDKEQPYPFANFLIPAVHTSPPVLFEPPSELTNKRHEVWVAAAGTSGWGGCELWASVNDTSYDRVGVIGPGMVIGALTTDLPAGNDPDKSSCFEVSVSASQGQLHPGSEEDADILMTASWIDGEMISYSACTLIGPHHYRLEKHLRRGQYKTSVKSHAAGTPFVRLNQAIFRHPYPPHLVGTTIYVKLPAFNEFQQMLQTLDEVPPHSLMLTGDSAK